jgi:hypothetical protein
MNERSDALKKVKEFYKKLGFVANMLSGALAEGEKR